MNHVGVSAEEMEIRKECHYNMYGLNESLEEKKRWKEIMDQLRDFFRNPPSTELEMAGRRLLKLCMSDPTDVSFWVNLYKRYLFLLRKIIKCL